MLHHTNYNHHVVVQQQEQEVQPHILIDDL